MPVPPGPEPRTLLAMQNTTHLFFVTLMTLSASVAHGTALKPADHLAIVATVNAVGSWADRKDWAAVEAQFAAEPFIDYASLSGQPGAQVNATELIAGWAAFLGDHVVSQHLVSGHEVSFDGQTAVVLSNVVAWHAPANAPNGPAWTVYGTYRHELRPVDGDWKIVAMTLNLLRQTGTPAVLTASS